MHNFVIPVDLKPPKAIYSPRSCFMAIAAFILANFYKTVPCKELRKNQICTASCLLGKNQLHPLPFDIFLGIHHNPKDTSRVPQ